MTQPSAASSTIGDSALAKLTVGKGTANTAIRWLPLFLPTLAIAFDSTTAVLALLFGLAEAAGLSTLLTGSLMDAGRERLVIIVALLSLVVASALALTGSIWLLGAAMIIIGAASGNITVAGHAWISARASFNRRARFIGIYEFSWASALLIGVPIIALLINWFGWRAPFIAIAVLAVLAALGVATVNDGERSNEPTPRKGDKTPITTDAWLVIGAAASIAFTGLSLAVVTGTWLDETLGVSTGGVGLVAILFGIAELIGSMSSSAFADRLGKRRSMQCSIGFVLVGLAVVAFAGSSLLIGATGLLIFFLGFEYAIVTSFSLVSEAMPESRGRALGVGNATSTVLRGIGVAVSGLLFERSGIHASVLLAVGGAIAALVFLAVIAPRRPDL